MRLVRSHVHLRGGCDCPHFIGDPCLFISRQRPYRAGREELQAEEVGEVLSARLPNNTLPQRQTPLAPRPSPSPTSLAPHAFIHVFCFLFCFAFFPHPTPLLTHPASTPPASPLCLSLTQTAEALMTFHSSIRHIQH